MPIRNIPNFYYSWSPDSLLEIEGYNLACTDNPKNIKRVGVYIYHKQLLPVWVISLPYLNQALFLQMTYNHKKVTVSVIHRSPSQNNNEFELFLSNFE